MRREQGTGLCYTRTLTSQFEQNVGTDNLRLHNSLHVRTWCMVSVRVYYAA